MNEKFLENQRKLTMSLESLTVGISKGLVIKYTPGTGTVYSIKKFFEDVKIDIIQSIQPTWHNDLAYRLFQMLKNNHDRVILIQDSMAVLRDPACANLIKAALEPGRAQVNWVRVGQRDHFEFTGRIIIVENEDFDHGIMARSMCIDLKVQQ